MKITIGTLLNNPAELRPISRGTSGVSANPDSGHSYDAVIIKSHPRQIEEHCVAKSIARELSAEVRETASREKIQDLQQQVAEGRYSVDAYAVASRMLIS